MGRQKIVIALVHPKQDYQTVGDLQNDKDLSLCDIDWDINALKEAYGNTYAKELSEYDVFYLDTRKGDYDRVYASSGYPPYLTARVTRLKTPSEILSEYIKIRDAN